MCGLGVLSEQLKTAQHWWRQLFRHTVLHVGTLAGAAAVQVLAAGEAAGVFGGIHVVQL